MMPTQTVTYQTPDGVERILRFTLGARKRIAEAFGIPDIQAIFNKYGDGALPEMAFAMMYDKSGQPPNGVAVTDLAEGIDDPLPLLAALMSAATKGSTPKNELEALLRKARQMEVERLIGSTFGASPDNASEFQPGNSGGSPSANLPPSVSASANPSDSSITAPA